MKQEIFRPEGIDLFFYKDDLDITIQQHIQGLDLWGIILLPIIAFFQYYFILPRGLLSTSQLFLRWVLCISFTKDLIILTIRHTSKSIINF